MQALDDPHRYIYFNRLNLAVKCSLRGEKGGRVYDSVGGLIHSENIQQRIADGEDWQRELITRGHALGIDVFASFRMNDNREYLGMCMYWVGAFQ